MVSYNSHRGRPTTKPATMADKGGFVTPITRYYVDTRSLVPDTPAGGRKQASNLPLIQTLPKEIQDKVNRFIRAPDRYMSLASALLKFLFIHRTAKVPWSEIRISSTPKPHSRPFWDPPTGWHGEGFGGVEFNVSHQAGMVVLVGCKTPPATLPAQVPAGIEDTDRDEQHKVRDPDVKKQGVRIGVDVACTHEPRRTPDLGSQEKLNEWVETFAEMFSPTEMKLMKDSPVPNVAKALVQPNTWTWHGKVMEQKARRFYTYWALKEAYIKMVGEGLLAGWLRKLEFLNVIPPKTGERFDANQVGMRTLFKGRDISDSIYTEMEGLDDMYILATMMRGVTEAGGHGHKWTRIDIEKEVRPCAEGKCSCLDDTYWEVGR